MTNQITAALTVSGANEASQTKRGVRWLAKLAPSLTGQLYATIERALGRDLAHNLPQWKQWPATIRPHIYVNNVLCTEGPAEWLLFVGPAPLFNATLNVQGGKPAAVPGERGIGFLLSVLSCNFSSCKEADR